MSTPDLIEYLGLPETNLLIANGEELFEFKSQRLQPIYIQNLLDMIQLDEIKLIIQEKQQYTHRKEGKKRNKKLEEIKDSYLPSEADVYIQARLNKFECEHATVTLYLSSERTCKTQHQYPKISEIFYLQIIVEQEMKCACVTPKIEIIFEFQYQDSLYISGLCGKVFKRNNDPYAFPITLQPLTKDFDEKSLFSKKKSKRKTSNENGFIPPDSKKTKTNSNSVSNDDVPKRTKIIATNVSAESEYNIACTDVLLDQIRKLSIENLCKKVEVSEIYGDLTIKIDF